MLTTNLAIVAPVTEADDRTAREAVWQQVTERIVPQMGKLCTRFEPSGGAWGQKVSSPYSVILGRNEPALFLYFYDNIGLPLRTAPATEGAAFQIHRRGRPVPGGEFLRSAASSAPAWQSC